MNHRNEQAWPTANAVTGLKCAAGPARSATLFLVAALSVLSFQGAASAADTTAEVKSLSVNGGLEDGKARLVIEAVLKGLPDEKDKLIFATALQHSMKMMRETLTHHITATLDVLQGEPKEFPLTIHGEGEIKRVTGADLQDWSVRQETNGTRTLVLRPRKGDKPLMQLTVTIEAERDAKSWSVPTKTLTLSPPQPALFNGYVKVESVPEWDIQADSPSGLVPIELKYLPEGMRGQANAEEPEPIAFRFHGSSYLLPLKITLADPEARRVVLREFRLIGRLSDETAAFTLNAVARVKNPTGGSLNLLSGGVALTDLEPNPDWRIKLDQGSFVLVFDEPGEYPLHFQFNAAVRQSRGWNSIEFRLAPSALQPVTFQGLAADTQFEFTGAARPERAGDDFTSFLPADGAVKLAWKEARPEAEGRLFYAAEMLSQISISPGLMRQIALIDFRVMQGELNQVVLLLRGQGSVTRVQGADVLAWQVEPGAGANERRLVVQLNQAQKDQFALQVQTQTELGTFPQAVDAMQLRPEGATRFAGHFRVVNEGAVRLEVVQSTGLSQVSPDQFPESDATKALFGTKANQRFAFRFSSADFALRIQADNILPELSVSQVLAYHLGETELAIETEIELDIREAPVRELILRGPKGYAIARLSASGLSDYFTSETADDPDAQLRLVYGQPISGRQVVQLRMERNAALGEASWVLPRIEVTRAKSTRGYLGVSADPGYRLTPERTQGLTEIATAFFPKKVTGIQTAFRLSDPAWEATLRVERLPQTVQADVFHLYSIGEGVAYGSSTINYLVSGAPISSFRIELSDEYFNVEFSGKDVRNWQKTTNGYTVQLHTPVSGTYTLLATYERPFRSQGDTLTFTGARPLDAQSEQGHTIVVSAYQFQVRAANVSAGLLALETAEVPSEYRLFFDAPILAAYRYTARPFNLQLALSPLAQGDTLSLVVDRAALITRISKDGEVLTDVRYFVKNRGNTHFRVILPEGTQLWSATVNGVTAVPVKDGNANLIPLPQRADPNAVQVLDLKLASQSRTPTRVTVAAPIVAAPVLLGEWKFEPDTGQRLDFRRGSLTPTGGVSDISGFAGLARMFSGPRAGEAAAQLIGALVLVLIAVWSWRWACREGTYRFGLRHLSGALLGVIAFVLAIIAIVMLGDLAERQNQVLPRGLSFLAPVQQGGSALSVTVGNLPEDATAWSMGWRAWPAVIALAVWGWAAFTASRELRPAAVVAGWTLLAWATLRWPNGAPFFLAVVVAFLVVHVAIPAVRQMFRLPRKAKPTPPPSAENGAAPAVALLAMLASVQLCNADFQSAGSQLSNLPAIANSPKPSRVQLGDTADFKSALRSAISRRPGEPTSALLLAQASSNPRGANTGSPSAAGPVRVLPKEPPLAESVIQDIRVEEKFALAMAKVRWHAEKGQILPLLFDPAVLTRITYPSNALKLVELPVDSTRAQQLMALESGSFDVEFQYQVGVTQKDGESGFNLRTQHGLVNRLTLTLVNLDVDVRSAQAVSVQRETAGSNTVATLVITPANDAWIGWKPRSRDVKREKAVFYAELLQLYVPTAGVIQGVHQAQFRPAQGELSELIFDVPRGATITDVIDPASTAVPAGAKNTKARGTSASIVSLWRFDPDTRQLRVSLSPPQSRPFSLIIKSQVATGPLPFEQTVGLVSVTNAAGQIGLIGVATGSEVQLDNVDAGTIPAINLEDFPTTALQPLAGQIAGLTVRRAFRYADPSGTLALKASAVEPDVRVETQQTLSLGEDRTVLAGNVGVTITRAGIFRLSFALPTGLDVESISGNALSHWTELRADNDRIITLHLKGKTEGQQEFAISLAGPGMRAVTNWAVPRLILREASKQRGQLLIVPEQGMRLQVNTREGVTQLDPQKAGIRQKGVLAFRLLQDQWRLTLDIEQVDPWVQVTSLQHITVSEAMLKAAVNLQYQIENTGLKALRVRIPTNAESVRFRGEQVADFLPAAGDVQDGLQTWDVKLHRRVIGKYLLQATWQTPLASQATNALVRGVQAADVNLQRGFVTVQTGGRLQVRAESPPAALQPTEWQSIPRALQQDIPAASANYTFRLVEAAYQLSLALERHEATKLLPARVSAFTLTSVISDEGVMLTQARLEMIPGDKRLLHLTLPENARFWFAFVNQNGVWPWRETNQILIPLEQQSRTGKALAVELFYSSEIGEPGGRSLDLELLGPKFDLPLENITWRVYLSEKWKLQDWTGTLQLQEDRTVPRPAAIDVQTYLQNEASLKREKTKEAEQLLAMGNTLLERGDPQQARRAFQAAYGLSTHDDAFNEDARVQLHNLKLQQALVGLNVRQAAVAGEADESAARLRDLRARKGGAYTQQEAKEIIDTRSAEENAALMRLAERIIQQQDAAVAAPAAIRASIPEQGRLLTFKRAVQVERFADLRIGLEASAARAASWGVRFLMLFGIFIVLGALAWAARGWKMGGSINPSHSASNR